MTGRELRMPAEAITGQVEWMDTNERVSKMLHEFAIATKLVNRPERQIGKEPQRIQPCTSSRRGENRREGVLALTRNGRVQLARFGAGGTAHTQSQR